MVKASRRRRGGATIEDVARIGGVSATTVWPELTTIRQPVAEMAEAAIELLMANLRSGDEEPRETERLLRHELIVRDSAAPPAESTRASRSGSLFQGKTGRP
jgi:LacI family transcriptional regulator